MMATNVLAGKTAVRGTKDGKLGFIVWFSVADQRVRLTVLRKCWAMAGLDMTLLPPDPRTLYLFKRAMRKQEGRVRQADGTIVETDVKPVLESTDECIYQISRVVRDLQNREVDYPKAMRVIYNKAREEVTKFEKLGAESKTDLAPMIDAILEYMQDNTKVVDGRKLRGLVRNFLSNKPDGNKVIGLAGENLRGKAGGIYFVRAEHEATLKALQAALRQLYEAEGQGQANYGVDFVSLMDDADAREKVRRAHVANTLKEMEEALADTKKLLRSERKNKVRGDVLSFHARRFKALQRQVAEYKTILHTEDSYVDEMIEAHAKQMEKLVASAA